MSSLLYKLLLHPGCRKDLQKVPTEIREQLLKKLKKLQENPEQATRLHSPLHLCFEIKLRSSGIRLVYLPDHEAKTITILAIGHKKNDPISDAEKRI